MIDNVFEQVISMANLYHAAEAASRGKRYRESTADFNFSREKEICRLHDELSSGMYRHGDYRQFVVRDPKLREISAAPFRDRVVHHAVHDVIEPYFDKQFIFDSYACRRGKGTHRALDRAQHFLRANRYYFHGDIRSYFKSIDRGILKGILARSVSDERLLGLLQLIIDSSPKSGLPIGNLTSQFFANLYLNELDRFAKQRLHIRYYVRYMDDIIILSRDRLELRSWKKAIEEFLECMLRLELHHGKTRIAPVFEGMSFLGFRLFNNYRRLRTDNVQRFRTKLRQFASEHRKGRIGPEKIKRSIESWLSHSCRANTEGLRRQLSRQKINGNWRQIWPVNKKAK